MTSEYNHSTSLLVLAAGLGSRYGGLKQLEQIGPNGETLMDYSIYDARKAGFTRVVFLIREEMQKQFEEQVGSKYEGILKVDYAYQNKNDLPNGFVCPPERERPWGTGHAVWSARSSLGETAFAVINADDYYGAETFEVLVQSFTKMSETDVEKNLLSMVGFRLSETLSDHGVVSRGICKESNGFLESVEEWTKIGGDPLIGLNGLGEKCALDGSEIVSMNVWGFPSSVIHLLEEELNLFLTKIKKGDLTSEFYLPAAIDAGIKSGKNRVRVFPASCSWMGVTYKEDKLNVVKKVNQMIVEGRYSSPLFET